MTNPVPLIIMALPESAAGTSVASKANIDAWFERIGFAGSIAPSLETLSQLHQLHPAAIPYENLDPLMGAPVRLDLANLQQKLLFDRRGGYCFEHNLLFKAMLAELDFEVKMHGARVLWGLAEGEEPPLRHLVLTVEVAGVTYLADVGFGGQTATAPLRLRADVPQETPLDTFRLLETDGTWQVDIEIEGEWRALYSFERTERSEEELVRLSEEAASSPFFTQNLLVARVEKGRRLALFNRKLNIHTVGAPSEARLLNSVAEMRELLAGPLGIQLPHDERLDPALQKIIDREPT